MSFLLLCLSLETYAQNPFESMNGFKKQAAQQAQNDIGNLDKKGFSGLSGHKMFSKIYFSPSFNYQPENIHSLGFSPFVGVNISKHLSVGAAPDFQYNTSGEDFSMGFRMNGQIHPKTKWPFLQLEYSGLNEKGEDNGNGLWSNASWVGLGYQVGLKKNTKIQFVVSNRLSYDGLENGGNWMFRLGLVSPLIKAKNKQKSLAQEEREKDKEQTYTPVYVLKKKPTEAQLEQLDFLGKLNFEGNISGSIKDPKHLDISPLFNYELDSNFSVGFGPSFQYKEDTLLNRSNFNYGLRLYTRYQINEKSPYIQLEYEGISALGDSVNWAIDERKFQSALKLGLGYKLNLKKVGNFQITILRDLTWEGVNPVNNSPWDFRFGYSTKLFSAKPGQALPSWSDLNNVVKDWMRKLNIEGEMSISPGNPRKVDLSPVFKIPLDSTLSVGVGFIYRFEQDSLDLDHRNNEQYGGKLFVRYNPKKKLPYLQLEYQGINAKLDSFSTDALINSKWEHALLLGAGYTLKLNEHLSFGATVLRNMTYKGITPVFNNPWVIRTSFSTPLGKGEPTGIPKEPPVPKQKEFSLNDHIKTEGNVGFSLGEQSYLDFSPLFGYEFKEIWTAGLGPTLKYEKNTKTKESSTIYGGRFYARAKPKTGLPFAQIEYEYLRGQTNPSKPRDWHAALLIGGGLNFPIGNNASFLVSALRDVTWKSGESLRNEPWVIRVGLGI
ncbi:hypothetical protein [Flexithrix dorotheae]|uniref:hypothetical protein n=1 Tax=Flexithrix dorotheae TaxID=70993 RepID=UPI00036F10F3|nr:hypothetical protein [Flexithrix dorotheae]